MYKVTELLSHGVALIPIPRGFKGPITSGWNEHRNVITSTQLATSLLGLNIGIAHAYCTPKAKQSAPARLCRHLTTCTSPVYFNWWSLYVRLANPQARAALMRVSALLQEWVVRVTEQLNPTSVWILYSGVGNYLNRWGFTPQKPIKKAYEQRPEAVKSWLYNEYPAIEQRAKAEGAEIH